MLLVRMTYEKPNCTLTTSMQGRYLESARKRHSCCMATRITYISNPPDILYKTNSAYSAALRILVRLNLPRDKPPASSWHLKQPHPSSLGQQWSFPKHQRSPPCWFPSGSSWLPGWLPHSSGFVSQLRWTLETIKNFPSDIVLWGIIMSGSWIRILTSPNSTNSARAVEANFSSDVQGEIQTVGNINFRARYRSSGWNEPL